MICYLFYKDTNNFIEAKDFKERPLRGEKVEIIQKILKVSDVIHTDDKIKIILNDETKETKKKGESKED